MRCAAPRGPPQQCQRKERTRNVKATPRDRAHTAAPMTHHRPSNTTRRERSVHSPPWRRRHLRRHAPPDRPADHPITVGWRPHPKPISRSENSRSRRREAAQNSPSPSAWRFEDEGTVRQCERRSLRFVDRLRLSCHSGLHGWHESTSFPAPVQQLIARPSSPGAKNFPC